MNIQNFKKGDKITRIEPTIGVGDRSYIGECLIFVGILNACIYYYSLNHTNLRNLKMIEWAEGWDYYKDPKEILNFDFLDNFKITDIENYLRKKKLNNLS